MPAAAFLVPVGRLFSLLIPHPGFGASGLGSDRVQPLALSPQYVLPLVGLLLHLSWKLASLPNPPEYCLSVCRYVFSQQGCTEQLLCARSSVLCTLTSLYFQSHSVST